MKYINKENDNNTWHKMFEEMPTTTSDVDVQTPEGNIIQAEIVVEMSGHYIYFRGENSHWGSLDDYTLWRFR